MVVVVVVLLPILLSSVDIRQRSEDNSKESKEELDGKSTWSMVGGLLFSNWDHSNNGEDLNGHSPLYGEGGSGLLPDKQALSADELSLGHSLERLERDIFPGLSVYKAVVRRNVYSGGHQEIRHPIHNRNKKDLLII